MNTFTTATHHVPAQSHVHPDRHPLSRPDALDPAWRREPLPDRVADPLRLQEVEPGIHDGLHVRLHATHARTDSRPNAPEFTRDSELPSLTEPADHLPPRVDLT